MFDLHSTAPNVDGNESTLLPKASASCYEEMPRHRARLQLEETTRANALYTCRQPSIKSLVPVQRVKKASFKPLVDELRRPEQSGVLYSSAARRRRPLLVSSDGYAQAILAATTSWPFLRIGWVTVHIGPPVLDRIRRLVQRIAGTCSLY